MGTFLTITSNVFKDLKDIKTTILSADTNVMEVRTINVDNKGNAPIRFNLVKIRIQGLTFRNCLAATTANLTNIIYDNGLSGIGATITNNASTLIAFTVDGVTPPINSRILVKNQSTTFQNGIYVLTTVGSNSIPWVLTRANDYNRAAQINPGDLIYVQSGNTNSAITYRQTATVTIIGTSPILFVVDNPFSINLVNEYEIKPYANENITCKTGPITLQYNTTPFISEKLVSFSNGYTQLYDCNLEYVKFNELP